MQEFINEMLRTENIDMSKTDKKMLLLDFACIFPYNNIEDLTFDFSVGARQCRNKVFNHRYRMPVIHTYTKKYKNKKLNKMGYPVMIDDDKIVDGIYSETLIVKYGIKDDYITIKNPIKIDFTGEKQIAYLALLVDAEDPQLATWVFETVETTKTSSHEITRYNMSPAQQMPGKLMIYHQLEDEINTVICKQTIEIKAAPLEKVFYGYFWG